MTDFAVSSDGQRVGFEVHGKGSPAVVLVHGWLCDRRYWRGQLAPLAASFLVVSLDLAGHGESDRSRRQWTIAAFGDDVAAVVRRLRLDDCIIVGHSMGVDVAIEAARRVPDSVRGLVWVDQYRQLDDFLAEEEVDARVAPFVADFGAATSRFAASLFSAAAAPELVARVSRQMASAPADIAVAALRATWNHGRSVPALLAQLSLPIVAINAPGSMDERASLARHGIEVLETPSEGHFPMLESPMEFNRLLEQAIDLVQHRRGDAVW